MKLLITFASHDTVLNVEVSDEMSLGDLKAYIEIESSVVSSSQILVYKTQPMEDDSLSLNHWKLENDDVIIVVEKPQELPGSTSHTAASPSTSTVDATTNAPGAAELEMIRQQILNDPVVRNNIEQRYPQLTEVLNDPNGFRELMGQIENDRRQQELTTNEEMSRLQRDPDNEENQQRILELIQQEAVMENLQNALEHNPEVFGNVTMLFVDVLVNGHRVKAFVDSGAQATVISPECVEKCALTHLIDRRFQGVAHGVGTAKILGRIHSAPIRVGNSFYPCSFTVMEGKSVDLLLGLDMLRRYQASIDLKRNVLVFGDSEVPFLPEGEIPKMFEDMAEEQNKSTSTGGGGSSGHRLGGDSSTSRLTKESNTVKSSNATNVSAATASDSTSASASSSISTPASFPEESVQNLVGLGFSRAQAINALRQAGGNAEIAAALLFQ